MAEMVVRIEGVVPSSNAINVNSTPVGTTPVNIVAPKPANINSGSTIITNSTTPTTFLTVPANSSWSGTVSVTAISSVAPGAPAVGTASVTIVGTGSTPATGTVLVTAGASSTGAGNTTTQIVYVAAPVGNSVTLQLTNSTATTFAASANANGTNS